MNENFKQALDFVLEWEGGYSDHPSDPGGETYRGITRRDHPEWPGWRVVERVKPENGETIFDPELENSLAMFYFDHYWRKASCDVIEQIAPATARSTFDMAVHSGPARAIKNLQNIIGTKMDGAFGPISQLALIDFMDRHAAITSVKKRQVFLGRLIQKNPKLKAFARGWENRLKGLFKDIQRG